MTLQRKILLVILRVGCLFHVAMWTVINWTDGPDASFPYAVKGLLLYIIIKMEKRE